MQGNLISKILKKIILKELILHYSILMQNCGKPITESTFEVQNEKPMCAKCVPIVSSGNGIH